MRISLRMWAIFAVPLLLLIVPALYYSLDTPIGLLERAPRLGYKYDSVSSFLNFLNATLIETTSRFRPFYESWNGLVWYAFGEVAWPHHLIRWLIYFGAAGLFLAAFMRISKVAATAVAPKQKAGFSQIVPIALLAYLWMLFPNSCNIRIECVEHYTVFFLGLCNYAAALMLTAGKPPPVRHHALFFLGFLGLVFSKEINVAPALWLLVCYWVWIIAKGVSGKRLLMGSMMAATLVFAIYKVANALAHAERGGAYWVPVTPIDVRFPENATEIIQALFQYETSTAITITFLFLLLALVVAAFTKLVRSGFNRELAFILLLLGEFISMFLVTSLQYGITPRYWSILIPCLAALLAFAAKHLIDAAASRKAVANLVAVSLAAFIIFFVSANYYSFLYQVAIQHSDRNLDDLLIGEVAQLLNAGAYIQGRRGDWAWEQLPALNSGWNRRMHWPNSPYGVNRIHRRPPKNPSQPYYILDIMGHPGLVSLETRTALTARSDYGILRYPAKVAAWAQGESPDVRIDWGMNHLGAYRWAIHAVPHNMADYLKELTLEAGEPVKESFFDVHYDGKKLTYVRNPCEESDIEEYFFLHFVPHDKGKLPAEGRRLGFVNWDFHFRNWGVKGGNVCVVVRQLPSYRLSWIGTGQYRMSGGPRIWETGFHAH